MMKSDENMRRAAKAFVERWTYRRGVSLDAPQSGHDGLTPYVQDVEYDNARPFDEKARWIVTCNFDAFRIYDRARPLAPPLSLRLADLPACPASNMV
jgi:hypothetical protein